MSKSRIIKEVIDGEATLAQALARLQIIAHDLKDKELETWAESELTGYHAEDKIPDYRRTKSINFIYSGFNNTLHQVKNIPLDPGFLGDDVLEKVSEIHFTQSLASIKDLFDSAEAAVHIDRSFLAGIVEENSDGLIQCLSIGQAIPKSFFQNVLAEIENRVIKAFQMLEEEHGCLDSIDPGVDFCPRAESARTYPETNINPKKLEHGALATKEKKYQVFISSTYIDLKEERAAVSQALLDLGCVPVGMEQFPASEMSQMEYIKKMLETCDYYILILAGRYGSIDPTDGIGFTEKEYDYAIENKIPVMSFLFDSIETLPDDKREQEKDKKERLETFRRKVSSGKMIKRYSTIDGLKYAVAISMRQCKKDFPAIGWVRADGIKADSTLEEKIDEYMKAHALSVEEINTILNEESPAQNKTKILYEPNEAGGNTAIII